MSGSIQPDPTDKSEEIAARLRQIAAGLERQNEISLKRGADNEEDESEGEPEDSDGNDSKSSPSFGIHARRDFYPMLTWGAVSDPCAVIGLTISKTGLISALLSLRVGTTFQKVLFLEIYSAVKRQFFLPDCCQKSELLGELQGS
jgi:hypothetical protein